MSNPRRHVASLGSILAVLAGALLLVWPGVYNGYPFLFDDTPSYVRGADAGVYVLTGHETPWTREYRMRMLPAAQPAAGPVAERAEQPPNRAPMAGRSVVYGFLIYLSDRAGSFWFLIVAQAIAASATILLTIRRFGPEWSRGRIAFVAPALVGILGLITPLAFYVCFVMPDILLPLAVIGMATLLLCWRILPIAEKSYHLVIVALAAFSHNSILLLLAAILMLLLLSLVALGWHREWRAATALGIIVLCGIANEAAISAATRYFTGRELIRPPFLSARIIADGPGTRYLADHCDKPEFRLCAYRDRFPMDSNQFLWDLRRETGVFSAVSSSEQYALADEQLEFVTAVVVDRPLDVVSSSFGAFADQTSRFALSEFNYSANALPKLPPHVHAPLRASLASKQTMPVRATEVASYVVTGLSLILLLVAALSRRRSTEPGHFAALCLLALVLNLAITGIVSTPSDRYNARAIWLLPLLAFCTLPSRRAARISSIARTA